MLADVAGESGLFLCRDDSRVALNRRSRSAATRRFSFGPIRLASLPLAGVAGKIGGHRARSDRVRREPDFVWAREFPGPFYL